MIAVYVIRWIELFVFRTQRRVNVVFKIKQKALECEVFDMYNHYSQYNLHYVSDKYKK